MQNEITELQNKTDIGERDLERYYLIKKFDSWFRIWWILFLIGFPLSIVLIGFPILIIAHIFSLILIYNLWKLIPLEIRETTPGRAVGFTFIPFFNIYWYFVAFLSLAKSLNVVIDKNQVRTNRIDEGFVLTFCILFIFHFIPYINILTSLVSIPFFIITLKQMKNAGKAIVQQQIETNGTGSVRGEMWST